MKYVEGRFRKDYEERQTDLRKNNEHKNDEQKKIDAQNKQLAEIRLLARSLRKGLFSLFFMITMM